MHVNGFNVITCRYHMTTLNQAMHTIRIRNPIDWKKNNNVYKLTALRSLTGGVRCGRYMDDCDHLRVDASLPTGIFGAKHSLKLSSDITQPPPQGQLQSPSSVHSASVRPTNTYDCADRCNPIPFVRSERLAFAELTSMTRAV